MIKKNDEDDDGIVRNEMKRNEEAKPVIHQRFHSCFYAAKCRQCDVITRSINGFETLA